MNRISSKKSTSTRLPLIDKYQQMDFNWPGKFDHVCNQSLRCKQCCQSRGLIELLGYFWRSKSCQMCNCLLMPQFFCLCSLDPALKAHNEKKKVDHYVPVMQYTGKLCHRGKCHSGNCHSGERWMSRPFIHSGNFKFRAHFDK